MGDYTRINVVADEDAEKFKEGAGKAIDGMQCEGFIVETQYTTTIQFNGRVLHSILILGRKNEKAKMA